MRSDWRLTEISQLCEGIYDGPHATPRKTQEGPIFLGISNLVNGRLDLSETEHLSEEDFVRWTKRVAPQPNDVVFSYETRLGEAALIPVGLRCCLGRRMALMRPDAAKVVPRFLLYSYLGPEFQQIIRNRTIGGSTVDRIPLVDFPSFPVRVPALPEQRRIAGALGALDDKIEHNRALSARLADLARCVFADWFRSLDRGPRVRVADLIASGTLAVGDGYRAKNSEMADHGVPFVRGRDVGDDVNTEGVDLLGVDGVRRAGGKIARVGDAFFTAKGTVGRIGRVSKWTPRFVYSPQIAFWRSLDDEVLSPDFLYLWIGSRDFIDQRDAVKGQTDMADYVNLRDQRAMQIPLPSPSAQTRLSSLVTPLLDAEALARSESRNLVAIRDALLPKLVSGAIRVPESYAA